MGQGGRASFFYHDSIENYDNTYAIGRLLASGDVILLFLHEIGRFLRSVGFVDISAAILIFLSTRAVQFSQRRKASATCVTMRRWSDECMEMESDRQGGARMAGGGSLECDMGFRGCGRGFPAACRTLPAEAVASAGGGGLHGGCGDGLPRTAAVVSSRRTRGRGGIHPPSASGCVEGGQHRARRGGGAYVAGCLGVRTRLRAG